MYFSHRRSRFNYGLGLGFLAFTFYFMIRMTNQTNWIYLLALPIFWSFDRLRTGFIYCHSQVGGNGARLYRNLGGVWWVFLFSGLAWYFADIKSADILAITVFNLANPAGIISSWYWIHSKSNLVKMRLWFVISIAFICGLAYIALTRRFEYVNLVLFSAQFVFVWFMYWIRKKIVT